MTKPTFNWINECGAVCAPVSFQIKKLINEISFSRSLDVAGALASHGQRMNEWMNVGTYGTFRKQRKFHFFSLSLSFFVFWFVSLRQNVLFVVQQWCPETTAEWIAVANSPKTIRRNKKKPWIQFSSVLISIYIFGLLAINLHKQHFRAAGSHPNTTNIKYVCVACLPACLPASVCVLVIFAHLT